jgi:hypothetical protein
MQRVLDKHVRVPVVAMLPLDALEKHLVKVAPDLRIRFDETPRGRPQCLADLNALVDFEQFVFRVPQEIDDARNVPRLNCPRRRVKGGHRTRQLKIVFLSRAGGFSRSEGLLAPGVLVPAEDSGVSG